MKISKLKKIALVVTTMTLVTSLAACSKKEAATDNNKPAQTTEKADPFGKYETPITVNAVRYFDVTNDSFPAGEDVNNNRWTKALEEQLGIKLKYNWVTSQAQYNQKLNLDIASNSIPDFFLASPQQFKQLVANDMIADLTTVYDKYITPEAKASLESDGGVNKAKVIENGKLMGIASPQNLYAGSNMIWIRNDWLKKLNLSAPKTQEDVIKIAQAFAKNDPDGNGKADTYGLGFNKDLLNTMFSIDGFASAYHAYPGLWVKDSSGKLVHGSTQPQMKTALAKLQELYKDGVIDKEFSVADMNKMIGQITSGKVGMFNMFYFAPSFPLSIAMGANPAADWRAYPLVSADKDPAKAPYPNGAFDIFVVNKNFKNPEVAVKFANLFVKLKNSEPTKYNSDAKYMYWGYGPIYYTEISSIASDMKTVDAAVKAKDPSKLTPSQKSTYDDFIAFRDNKDMSKWKSAVMGVSGSVSGFDYGSTEIAKNYIENKLTQIDAFQSIPSENYTAKKANMDKLQLETFTKIIMGSASIDEFDKFVEQWKKLGGDEATKEVNDWAAKQK
jgi:putative aldouronate transport system substrate-binding protein